MSLNASNLRAPQALMESDRATLREAGLSDAAIHDAAAVIVCISTL